MSGFVAIGLKVEAQNHQEENTRHQREEDEEHHGYLDHSLLSLLSQTLHHKHQQLKVADVKDEVVS
jgi:hypothetical protein